MTMTTESLFAGLKVLDASSFIAGPAAATVLGDFGADVIKVEPPGMGDSQRRLGSLPPNPSWASAPTRSRNRAPRGRFRARRGRRRRPEHGEPSYSVNRTPLGPPATGPREPEILWTHLRKASASPSPPGPAASTRPTSAETSTAPPSTARPTARASPSRAT
ncbi:CoA transferase [Streptomyces sp. NPDC003480]